MAPLRRSRQLLLIAFLLILQGIDDCTSQEDYLEKCCELGDKWASQKLRCEKFSGPVPGVPRDEQAACLETVDICCRRSFQERECEEGKADAKAGQTCSAAGSKSGSGRSTFGDYKRDCCEGCKLGILTGSSGKSCVSKKFSLGIPWDPAFMECCNEAITSTTRDETSPTTIASTFASTSSSTVDTPPDSFEFDDDLDDETTDPTSASTFKSDDLCQLMKGLLCSEICVPTPGSYYCKCQEGSTLQADGRTCKSNITTTKEPTTVTVPSTTIAVSSKPSTYSTVPLPSTTSTNTTVSSTLTTPSSSIPTTLLTSTPLLRTSTTWLKATTLPASLKSTSSKNSSTTSTSSNSPSTVKIASSTSTTTTSPLLTSAASTSIDNKRLTLSSDNIETTLVNQRSSTGGVSSSSFFRLWTSPAKSRTTRSTSTEDNELTQPCPAGYRFNPNTYVCDDIDECAVQRPPSCPPGTTCLNVNGSYRCDAVAAAVGNCKLGFRWNDTLERCYDVDECLEHTHKCLVDTEICKNLEGSYECEIKCERGYAFNGNYGTCLDINECTETPNACPQSDTICMNTLGSFVCMSLLEYQRLNEPNHTGSGSDDRRVSDYDGLNEADIDECQVQHQPCAPGEICRNTIGGYDCLPASCPRGFVLVNEACQDLDECKQNLHSCAPYERCQNTNGSFTCEPPRPTRRPTTTELPKIICRKGYKADNKTSSCVDIDECVEGPGCRDHERCRNLQGSYDCSPLCGPGWYFQLQTKSCQDVDECLLGHHNCRQRTHYCRNTNGSYICELLTACSLGFRRTQNGSCVDIDECLESLHSCSRESHRYCVNREGGYECITRLPSCSRGFEYSLFTQQCEDIDECRSGRASCDSRLSEHCVNLPGSYRCERPLPDLRSQRRRPACPAGFSYDVAQRKCSDIDECADGSHNCGEQKCYNLPGSFQCANAVIPVTRRKLAATPKAAIRSTDHDCSIGSRYDSVRGGCVDVNECEELEEACSSNEECLNTPGSFQCTCLRGYRRDELTLACVDINECQLENDCLPSQRCDNTIGSYTCVRFLPCGTGYTLNAATEICEDDDECVLGTHDCGNGYHCRNTLGSYRCDKDRGRTTTTVRTTTRRTIRPSYRTTTGWTTARTTTTSTSTTTTTQKQTTTILPATTTTTTTTTTPRPTTTTTTTTTTPRPTTTSTTTTTSTPRPGPITTTTTTTTTPRPITRSTTTTTTTTTTPRASTTPVRATTTTEEIPTVGTLATTTPRRKAIVTIRPRTNCPRGFESGPIGQCIDINECSRNSKICGSLRCINVIGSFKCEIRIPRIICGIGFTPDPSTGTCKDVDECALGTHKCGPKQTCENRQGGYICYCPPGYEVGGNHDCVDVNECTNSPSICGSHSRCLNTPGSYRCLCDPGYENDASGGCRDVDECHSKSGLCQQVCYNTWGGHRCDCHFGYRLKSDNRTCEDIDECQEFKENNLCVGICDNTPGSYACSCPDGYRLSEDGRTCQDIDECAAGNVCTAHGEFCQNVRGGFRCNRINCPPGYIKDPQRKNRCVRENQFCPVKDLACFQRPSHYSYNYIALVSMYPIPVSTGQVELFTMRGAYHLPDSTVTFSVAFIQARAPPNIIPATESCFALRRPFPSQAVLVLTKSLQGPQDIELEFSMEIYGPSGNFAGSAVARIFIIVTQYEF